MTVIYLDSVWVLNTLMDYLLLLATAQLAGLPLRRRRLLAAAALGGCYAAAVFLPGLAFLSSPPAKLLSGVAIAGAAFWGQRRFLRLTLLFFIVSCGFAGSVLALGLITGSRIPSANGIFYTNVSAKVLLISATAAYVVLSVVFRACARHGGIGGERIPVRIQLSGRLVELAALADTGCSLRDPMTGQPVLIAAASRLEPLWPAWQAPLLSPRALRDPTGALERLHAAGRDGLRFQLLPYTAVGVSGNLLLAFRSDCTWVGKRAYPQLLVALSPNELGEEFAALWGGETQKGVQNYAAGYSCASAGSADPPGSAAPKSRSLHRRK